MQTQTAPRLSDDPGIRFGYAHVAVVLTLLLAGALRLGDTTTQVLVVVVTGAVGAGLPRLLRPVLGLVAWAFVTGFVANSFGQLTFGGADDRRLLVFVLAVPTVAAVLRASVAPRSTS